ncbi:Uncharacterised protein [Vibrio cholerae]|nr:Uncharacterised protein [Vibrio cholerae]CSC34338.1 Uncharacterised protein [Vibrio cholerae]CSI94221.1 Uncharacterised protein [Vibrio cholerae]
MALITVIVTNATNRVLSFNVGVYLICATFLMCAATYHSEARSVH